MVVYMTVLGNRPMAMLPIMSMVVFSIMSVGDHGISLVIPIGNTLNPMLIGEDLRNRRKVQTISSFVGSIQVGSIQVVTMVTRGEKTLLVVMLSGIVVSSRIGLQNISSFMGIIQVVSIQVGSIQVVTMVTRGEKTLLEVMLSGIVVSSRIGLQNMSSFMGIIQVGSIQVGSIQVGSIQVVTMVTRGVKTLLDVVVLAGIIVNSRIGSPVNRPYKVGSMEEGAVGPAMEGRALHPGVGAGGVGALQGGLHHLAAGGRGLIMLGEGRAQQGHERK